MQPSTNAPWSSTKKEVIEESYGPGQKLVLTFLEMAMEKLKIELTKRIPDPLNPLQKDVPAGFDPKNFILDADLVQLIQDRIYEGRHNDRLEKPSTLRKVAKTLGWFIGEKRTGQWGMRKQPARIISLDPVVASTDPEVLAKQGKTPFDVRNWARRWMDDF